VNRPYLAIPTEVVDAVHYDIEATFAVVWLYRRSEQMNGAPFPCSSRMAQEAWRMGTSRVEALLARLISLGVVEVVKPGIGHSPRWLRVVQ